MSVEPPLKKDYERRRREKIAGFFDEIRAVLVALSVPPSAVKTNVKVLREVLKALRALVAAQGMAPPDLSSQYKATAKWPGADSVAEALKSAPHVFSPHGLTTFSAKDAPRPSGVKREREDEEDSDEEEGTTQPPAKRARQEQPAPVMASAVPAGSYMPPAGSPVIALMPHGAPGAPQPSQGLPTPSSASGLPSLNEAFFRQQQAAQQGQQTYPATFIDPQFFPSHLLPQPFFQVAAPQQFQPFHGDMASGLPLQQHHAMQQHLHMQQQQQQQAMMRHLQQMQPKPAPQPLSASGDAMKVGPPQQPTQTSQSAYSAAAILGSMSAQPAPVPASPVRQ